MTAGFVPSDVLAQTLRAHVAAEGTSPAPRMQPSVPVPTPGGLEQAAGLGDAAVSPRHTALRSASAASPGSPGTRGIRGSREVGYERCDGSRSGAGTGMPFLSPRMERMGCPLAARGPAALLAGSSSQTDGTEHPGLVQIGMWLPRTPAGDHVCASRAQSCPKGRAQAARSRGAGAHPSHGRSGQPCCLHITAALLGFHEHLQHGLGFSDVSRAKGLPRHRARTPARG